MTTLLYPTRAETVVRASALPPVPELAVTAPTERLERAFFATVAAVCDMLSDPHNLKQMTRGDLVRLVRVGELARQELDERNKEIEL